MGMVTYFCGWLMGELCLFLSDPLMWTLSVILCMLFITQLTCWTMDTIMGLLCIINPGKLRFHSRSTVDSMQLQHQRWIIDQLIDICLADCSSQSFSDNISVLMQMHQVSCPFRSVHEGRAELGTNCSFCLTVKWLNLLPKLPYCYPRDASLLKYFA